MLTASMRAETAVPHPGMSATPVLAKLYTNCPGDESPVARSMISIPKQMMVPSKGAFLTALVESFFVSLFLSLGLDTAAGSGLEG